MAKYKRFTVQCTDSTKQKFNAVELDVDVMYSKIALLRNRWLGVMKGLESKNFMLGHVVRLRTAGMEDIVV